MARLGDGSEKDACMEVSWIIMGWKVRNTLEANFVALQTFHGLDEEGLACRGHSREVILLPLNGGINVFKDFLHGVCDFCTDTISWDEGNLMDNVTRQKDKQNVDERYAFRHTW